MIVQPDTSRESSARRGADIRTFLFADMRGYTRFTQERGDDAASALAGRFADLVKDTVSEFEGELLELRGDEALCVFRSARQALRAAVDLQRRLRAATAEEPAFPIGVGMGLDAGEAVPTHGGYRGASLNLAARLCASAKPGEILATESVAHLAHRVDGVRLVEGRSLRLKGITKAVRCVEVTPIEALPPLPDSRPAGGGRRRQVAAVCGGVAFVAVIAAVTVAAILGSESASNLRLVGDSAGAVNFGGSGLAVRARVGSQPQAIAAGDGAVWVVNSGDGTVYRLNPKTGSVVDRIPAGREPTGIATGAGGVWVVDSGTNRLLRISPGQNDAIVPQADVGNGASAVAVSGTTVWVANTADGTLSKVRVSSGKAEGAPIPLSASPSAIATGAGGLWVASQDAGVVLHLTSAGDLIRRIPVGAGPASIAVQRNAVWVADSEQGTLWRINPKTDNATPSAHLGGRPTAVAVGDGRVWVAEQGGKLVSVDPNTGNLHTVAIGGSPAALAVGSGRVWVASLPSTASHRGGTLRVIADTCTVCHLRLWSVDPDATYDAPELMVVTNVYDGLVGYRRVGGIAGAQLVPDLAEALPTVTNGGRTLTFRVRPDIRYSDGRPVRPEDFRRGVERAFELQNGLILATGYYSDLIGAGECAADPKTCNLDRGITTNDQANTVTFHLHRPDPTFVYKLALTTADAVPPSVPNHDIGTHPFPGTGPYKIQHFGKRSVVLVRNRRFRQWSAAAQPQGYPNRIVIHLGDTPDYWRAYLAGKYDLLVDQTPPPQLWPALRRIPNQVHNSIVPGLSYLILNTLTPPFSNVLVRRALNDATNRQVAAEDWVGPGTVMTCQIIPPDFPGYKPYCPYTQSPSPSGAYHGPDLAAGRALVRQAHATGESAHLTYPDPVVIGVTNYFARVLRRLGLHADVHNAASWHGPINGGVTGWNADWPSPSDFFTPLLGCGQPNNPGGYCNHRIDAQVAQAARLDLSDPGAARALWQRIDREVTDQAPLVVIDASHEYDLTSTRTGNFQFNPHYAPLIDQMWVR